MSKGHCLKDNEIANWRACTFLKWKRREFCLNREAFMTTLKRKLNELFKDNLQLGQDDVRQRVNWTRSNAKEETLMLLLLKLADSFSLRDIELYQANQLTQKLAILVNWI